jgi:hypothetical protein
MNSTEVNPTRTEPPADPEPPIPTLAKDLVDKLQELREGLSFLEEEPTHYLSTLRRLGVVAGLSYEQAVSLSSTIGQLYKQGDSVRWLEPHKCERRRWAREGSVRIRKLSSKLDAARSAILAVQEYSEQSDVPLSKLVVDALDLAMSVLDPSELARAQSLVSTFEPEPQDRAMLTLYDFLLECGVQRADAEVRVAKIGNQLWDWDVAFVIQPKPLSDERRGSEAVRKAIARRHRDSAR